MEDNFFSTEGNKISDCSYLKHKNSLKIIKAAKVYNGILDLIEIRQTMSKDVIVFDFHLDEPQHPINDIRGTERIMITIDSDKTLPKVFSLREDFPIDITHLNSRSPQKPRWLCIYEETWDELKLKWSAEQFLSQIKRWLELTSLGKLHQEDQPLEPFITSEKVVVYGKDWQDEPFIKKISDNFYRTTKDFTGRPFIPLIANVEVAHGIIHSPYTVGDLVQILPDSFNFIKILKKRIDEILELPEQQQAAIFNNGYFLLTLLVDIKRDENNTPETSRKYCFLIDETIGKLGLNTDILIHNKINLNIYVPHILIGKQQEFCVENIKDTSIEALNIVSDFDLELTTFWNNSLKEKTFSLIGCGALGSQLIQNMARTAYGKWNIIDDDKLYPHNLMRHTLKYEDIGLYKAGALHNSINQKLYNKEDFILHSFNEKIEEDKISQILDETLASSDFIIDNSTSISVERLLVNKYPNTRKMSSFLNPNGTDLVLLTEDKECKTTLDLLEYQYYKELINNGALHSHLIFENTMKVRYARGCRDVSSRISQDNLSIFSGILSKAIKSEVEKNSESIQIWSLDEDFAIQKHSFKSIKWSSFQIQDWMINLSNELLSKLQKLRLDKLPNETGGILLGGVDKFYKKIYLVDTIFSPSDSIEKPSFFIRGIDDVSNQLKIISNRTNEHIYYLGEWHSHPKHHSVRMSKDDHFLFSELRREATERGEPVFMLILGDDKLNMILYNQEIHEEKSISLTLDYLES